MKLTVFILCIIVNETLSSQHESITVEPALTETTTDSAHQTPTIKNEPTQKSSFDILSPATFDSTKVDKAPKHKNISYKIDPRHDVYTYIDRSKQPREGRTNETKKQSAKSIYEAIVKSGLQGGSSELKTSITALPQNPEQQVYYQPNEDEQQQQQQQSYENQEESGEDDGKKEVLVVDNEAGYHQNKAPPQHPPPTVQVIPIPQNHPYFVNALGRIPPVLANYHPARPDGQGYYHLVSKYPNPTVGTIPVQIIPQPTPGYQVNNQKFPVGFDQDPKHYNQAIAAAAAQILARNPHLITHDSNRPAFSFSETSNKPLGAAIGVVAAQVLSQPQNIRPAVSQKPQDYVQYPPSGTGPASAHHSSSLRQPHEYEPPQTTKYTSSQHSNPLGHAYLRANSAGYGPFHTDVPSSGLFSPVPIRHDSRALYRQSLGQYYSQHKSPNHQGLSYYGNSLPGGYHNPDLPSQPNYHYYGTSNGELWEMNPFFMNQLLPNLPDQRPPRQTSGLSGPGSARYYRSHRYRKSPHRQLIFLDRKDIVNDNNLTTNLTKEIESLERKENFETSLNEKNQTKFTEVTTTKNIKDEESKVLVDGNETKGVAEKKAEKSN